LGLRKIAAVFAGQGAQYPGMGKSLYEVSAAARSVFDAAGEKVKRDCFDATQEELNMTDITQPAVYAVDMAAWAAFAERLGRGSGIKASVEGLDIGESADRLGREASVEGLGIGSSENEGVASVVIAGMAGFSLGEYAAFTAAGVIPDVATGIGLIKERGRLMAAAGRRDDGSSRGAMAAVLGARGDILELVESARGDLVLEAVNLNAPTQTAIAGDAEAIENFAAQAKASEKKLRVIPIPVSTAFHSPIMAPASDGIREAASKIAFGDPAYDIYLDMTAGTLAEYAGGASGKAMGGGSVIPDIMAKQVMSPVRWQEITEALAAAGAEAIIEFGPGKTLTGFTRKTTPEVKALNVSDAESLEATLSCLAQL
jgi:[acyl-carrier-protein] S-malonyltransferase